jgi:hypothetical protein
MSNGSLYSLDIRVLLSNELLSVLLAVLVLSF